MDRRSFCISILSLPAMMPAALAQTRGEASPGKPAVWDKFREIHFVLHDPLDHPFYWWPRTLLSYPIEFHAAVDLNRLRLTRVDTLEQVPIQFSEVVRDARAVRSAVLHFVSDLPSGGRREFVLSAGEVSVVSVSQIHETREGNTIVLDSGAMRVRIPATQDVHSDAPGPVMQVSRGGAWIGSSTLNIFEDRVTRIVADRVASGPLFIAYELTYETAGGSRYVARVQCDGGFDFVRLREDMDGLRPGAHGTFTCDWTALGPTHRQAPNHPFPVPDEIRDYDEYVWERIDEPWHNLDARCGSSRAIYPEVMPPGELPIVLGIYQPAPGNFLIANWANFWNDRTGDALGVFIDNATEWRDHEYAYELESPALQVRTFHQDGKFSWKWPLARGCRSTCLTFYDHAKDKEAMRELLQNSQPVQKNGITYQVPLGYTSHTLFLQNRHGTIDLNRVKDWVLDYPEDSRRQAVIFTGGSVKGPAELEQNVMTLPYVCTLPVTGARQMDGSGPLPGRGIVNFSPVPSRRIEGSWIDGFNRLNAAMNERQRARLTAMYLFLAYVQGGDEFMPVVPMLSGHPNYLADVKFAPPAMSFLFPEHPMSSTWADMWQKCMELNTRYNTRPAVETWDADGGRWTEDIGTYVFAFLRPALRTEFLLRKLDGVQRFVTPQLAEMAEWLVNALSAPYEGESAEGYRNLLKVNDGRGWGVVAPGEGPRRVYPPIGAHSERRLPPRSLWYLGTCLRQYAPMAAEHAMWASRPTDQDAESAPGSEPPWDDIMYREAENRGTNPHLRSRKHTGYGVVLRAAVGTPDEMSVHLQQIDEGPNYRWGWAGQGGCGALYFFAAGKAFGFNGSEDGGDRRDADTDFCTNFGVFKDGEFRSVGQNALSRPFYDLSCGQFMEIVPRESASPYSFPEYVGRSVLLAGHDYFMLYDQVRDASVVHRLSWFVRRGDVLPAIHLLRGGSAERTDMQTATSTGVWFDASGDSMAVVSHRGDLQPNATPYGCRVVADGVDDLIFRNSKSIHFSDATGSFDGTAGLIRHRKDGSEFAMFHGTRIGVSGLVFVTTDTDLGIGGSIVPGQPPRGEYYAPKPSTVTITLPAPANSEARFYIDGEAQAVQPNASGLVLNLQAGHHHWELTDTLPIPAAPQVVRTANRAGGARIFVAPVAAANQYRLELSKDHGSTWSTITVQANHEIEVNDLPNGDKVHVRAVALNTLHESLPGPEYPLYVTSGPPATPDGLHVELSDGAATLTWGEVLGVTEYRLYVRAAGSSEFHVLYRGLDRLYRDKRQGIQAALAIPEENGKPTPGLTEYCVCAVNGNGESPKSRTADTNPASWRNWDPRPGERFRRVYSFSPGAPPSPDADPAYYPR